MVLVDRSRQGAAVRPMASLLRRLSSSQSQLPALHMSRYVLHTYVHAYKHLIMPIIMCELSTVCLSCERQNNKLNSVTTALSQFGCTPFTLGAGLGWWKSSSRGLTSLNAARASRALRSSVYYDLAMLHTPTVRALSLSLCRVQACCEDNISLDER